MNRRLLFRWILLLLRIVICKTRFLSRCLTAVSGRRLVHTPRRTSSVSRAPGYRRANYNFPRRTGKKTVYLIVFRATCFFRELFCYRANIISIWKIPPILWWPARKDLSPAVCRLKVPVKWMKSLEKVHSTLICTPALDRRQHQPVEETRSQSII